MWKIYKNDSGDLDFVLACLFCQSISIDELRLWAEEVILTTAIDKIPSYMFELMDFHDSLLRIDEIIGFTPNNYLSKEEEFSLYGIAFLRGVDVYDPPIDRCKALGYLMANNNILVRFNKFFPFIKLICPRIDGHPST